MPGNPKTSKRKETRTDWERVKRLTDAEIEAAVAADPDAAPIVDIEWMRRAKRIDPNANRVISTKA